MGIQLDYFQKDCQVISYQEMTSKDNWLEALNKSPNLNNESAILVVFVGDSNTCNQYNYFRDHITNKRLGSAKLGYLDGRFKLTYIDMMGTWPETFAKAQTRVKALLDDTKNKNDRFFTLFNIGLHEITNRCASIGLVNYCYLMMMKHISYSI